MMIMDRSRIIVFLTVIMFMATMVVGVSPAYGKSQNIHININGSQLPSDVPPQIVDNHTLAPMRVIFEALGASVDWDEETGLISGHKGSTNVQFEVGSMTAIVDGEEVELEVPLMIIDGRALVPVRFLSEVLGMDVEWDAENFAVEINDLDDEDDNDEDSDDEDNEDGDQTTGHYNYNSHFNYNAHDNGNNYHENYNFHYVFNSHENGENYHENYNYHYNSNQNNGHPNNGHHGDDDGDIVTPATVTIVDLYSDGEPAPAGDGVTLFVEGQVEDAPDDYALLVKIGIPGHGSVMLWSEYENGSGAIDTDGNFKLAYELEPGQDLLEEDIFEDGDPNVSAVIIRPDADPALELLAIAESKYEDADGNNMIAYNVIVKNGADYEITTQHGVDSDANPRLEADQDGMDDGSILSGYYFTTEYEMTLIKFYEGGVLFDTFNQAQLDAVTNKLP